MQHVMCIPSRCGHLRESRHREKAETPTPVTREASHRARSRTGDLSACTARGARSSWVKSASMCAAHGAGQVLACLHPWRPVTPSLELGLHPKPAKSFPSPSSYACAVLKGHWPPCTCFHSRGRCRGRKREEAGWEGQR